jgi:hypothetical protein
MSINTFAGSAGAGFYVLLLRIFVIVAAPALGFLYAETFEYCGPRLLSICAGVGIVVPFAGSVAVRIMRLDASGAVVFIILATAFVYFAGPMMDGCRPGIAPHPVALSQTAKTERQSW